MLPGGKNAFRCHPIGRRAVQQAIRLWIACCLSVSTALAQEPVPRQPLDEVVQTLSRERDWKSPEAIPLLETVLRGNPDADDTLTASVLLAFYLADRTSDPSQYPSERIQSLCGQVRRNGAGTWQAAVAEWLLAAERGFSGDHATGIAMARNALETIDFEALDKEEHPAWLAIKRTMGDEPFVLREVFKMFVVNALCDTYQLDEARKLHATMTDMKYAKEMEERIALLEKTLRERSNRPASAFCKEDPRESLPAGNEPRP